MGTQTNKQKYIIECLISSNDLFSRCISIVKAEYFDKNLERVVDFIVDYYGKHNGIPPRKLLKVEFDLEFDKQKITKDVFSYVSKEVETFCKEVALKNAIRASMEDIETKDYGLMSTRLNDALTISLDRDIGVEFFDDPENYLESLIDSQTHEPTEIKALDEHLGGGLIKKELTLFSANSGGGKSIMLNNIGLTFAHKGYHVVYISLELGEDKIYLRSSSIWTDTNIKEWQSHIPEMSSKIKKGKKNDGSFVIKRLPQQSCCNDFKSYLKQYELEYGRTPDMLIVDYLDLMSPNGGGKNMGVFEKDKHSSEQFTELLYEYDMFGLSASQQNRDAIGNSAPEQNVIAGGISKINTVDNYISLYMDPAMRLIGKMMIYFLKTRSSDGVGKSEEISFNTKTLTITDVDCNTTFSVMPKPRPKKVIIENNGNTIESYLDVEMPFEGGTPVETVSDFDEYVESISIEEDEIRKKKAEKQEQDKSKKKKKKKNKVEKVEVEKVVKKVVKEEFNMDSLGTTDDLLALMTSTVPD